MNQVVNPLLDFWTDFSAWETRDKLTLILVAMAVLSAIGRLLNWLLTKRQKLRVKTSGIDKNLSRSYTWTQAMEANSPSYLMMMCLSVKSICDVRTPIKGYRFKTKTTNERQNWLLRLGHYLWDRIKWSKFVPITGDGDIEPAGATSDWKDFQFYVKAEDLPFHTMAVVGTWGRRWKVPREHIDDTNKTLLEDWERVQEQVEHIEPPLQSKKGKAIFTECPDCGTENPSAKTTCSECGHSLRMAPWLEKHVSGDRPQIILQHDEQAGFQVYNSGTDALSVQLDPVISESYTLRSDPIHHLKAGATVPLVFRAERKQSGSSNTLPDLEGLQAWTAYAREIWVDQHKHDGSMTSLETANAILGELTEHQLAIPVRLLYSDLSGTYYESPARIIWRRLGDSVVEVRPEPIKPVPPVHCPSCTAMNLPSARTCKMCGKQIVPL